MAIAVTFTPTVGVPGGTPGTVSAALTGLASNGTYNFTVDGPNGTYEQLNVTISGTTYTLVFPLANAAGTYTLYTQVSLAARAAVPSGTYTSSSIN